MSTQKWTIEETDTEYRLRIPYDHKDRAKSIEGYRWNKDLTCWVYPRNNRIYDALIAEFGDDLVSVKISRPDIIKKQKLDTISSKDSEIESFKQNIKELIAELSASRKEIARLQKNNINQDFITQFKEILKNGTGNDKDFSNFIDKLKIDKNAPNEITKYLTLTLRNMLGINDRVTDLYGLINQARDANILNEEARNLANLIRTQRNIITHDDIDQRTDQPRIMLILFAASLLWPLLPE